MSGRYLLPTLLCVTLLAACSDSDNGPGADSDLRGLVLDNAGQPVAGAAVFLEYDLDDVPGGGSAPADVAAKPQTAIRFELPEPVPASVWIGDFCGADTVRTLVRETDLPAGMHAVVWDGRDDDGRFVPDGVYWVHVDTPTSHNTDAALMLHLGYGDLAAETAVAAPALSDAHGRYRLEQGCLPLGFTLVQTDELGEPIGSVAIARRVRVWASRPDHGLGHTDWLVIDDTRGRVADVTLAL